MMFKQTGLYFGSFNPVHNGHLMIANFVAEFTGIEEVWFVISPLNPFKAETDLLADYHRRELLHRAIGDYPRFRVSSVEFSLPKPSYTIDTLTFLEKKYPDRQFTLLMGSDQLPDFHRWKEPDKILDRFNIMVYPRLGSTENHLSGPLSHSSVQMLNAPVIEISSTFIRQAIGQGKDVRFYMPELSWQYLDEMNFYRKPVINP